MKNIIYLSINLILISVLLSCGDMYNDIREDIELPFIEITSFHFETPEADGIINNKNHTIVVNVPTGTNVDSLIPIITHTGVSINPGSGISQNFTSPVTYTIEAEDGSTLDYTVTVLSIVNKAITAFNFSNPVATGVINEINHSIEIIVPYATNVTSLIPTITHTGSSVYPGSGLAQNFTSPVTYTVTAGEDGSTQDYIVTVIISQLATVITYNITTNYKLDIIGTSARGGGNVTSQGNSAVIERGLCWNTSGLPTINNSYIADGSGTGIFESASMTGLNENTTYYVRAYAINSKGTAYGNEVTFNSGWAFGTVHAGGYVFYNDGNGGGLVAAMTDQSTSQAWITGGFSQTTSIGSTSQALGTGLANSNAIIASFWHEGSAAQICLDYNDGTYSDWYLPSIVELDLMYSHLKSQGSGGFANATYWSSSEVTSSGAWLYDFYIYVGEGYTEKSVNLYVRSIRTF